MTTEKEKRCGVYIFQCMTTKRVKIGLSKNVDERKKAIQSTSPTELKEVVFIPDNTPHKLEELLHVEFKEFRIHGEWFSCGIIHHRSYEILMLYQEAGVFGDKIKGSSFYDIVMSSQPGATNAKK